MPQPFEPARDPEATRKLLASLWESNLPLLHERFALLDRAAAAAQTGPLPPRLRAQAVDTAHKLAGSLGMFGYPEGTASARRIEQLLETPGPIDPLQLAAEVAVLRTAVPL